MVNKQEQDDTRVNGLGISNNVSNWMIPLISIALAVSSSLFITGTKAGTLDAQATDNARRISKLETEQTEVSKTMNVLSGKVDIVINMLMEERRGNGLRSSDSCSERGR